MQIQAVKTKCDICDAVLDGDYQVIEHLESEGHRQCKIECLNHHRKLNEASAKTAPISLTQLLDSLKLRSKQDIDKLNQKNFFKIDQSVDTKVVKTFAKILFKSVIEYDSKCLNDTTRRRLMNTCKATIQADVETAESLPQPEPVSAARDVIELGAPDPSRNSRRSETRIPERPRQVAPTMVRPDEQPSCLKKPRHDSRSRSSTSSEVGERRKKPRSLEKVREKPSQDVIRRDRTSHSSSRSSDNPIASTSQVSDVREPVQPQPSSRQYQPIRDSTYIPKLKVIKIEPKDD